MDIFSNLQVIGECLLDQKRVALFEKAINGIVKPGDTVIDLGTGSSILALLSAKAGASKVYGVEIAPDVADFARRNVAANNLTNIVSIIEADTKLFNFPHAVDVVTAEMLDTCLVAEQQAQALNNLHERGIITEKTKLIPYKMDCAVQAINYNFNFYGFNMPFVIQARNFGVKRNIKKKLSKPVIYKSVYFNKIINTNVEEEVYIEIKEDGFFNAINLCCKTFLDKSSYTWGTTDMNMPVVLPVQQRLVKKGDVIKLKIKYIMGEGFDKLQLNLA